MKRYVLLILCLMLFLGCSSSKDAFNHERFSLVLPEGWERCDEPGVVCFALDGSAVHASNITFYATDKNYYFDRFSQNDYSEYLNAYAQYEQIAVTSFDKLKIDGWAAHRVTYSATVDQAEVTLVVYVIDADMSYIFTLLQVEGESYIDFFDKAMSNVEIHTK